MILTEAEADILDKKTGVNVEEDVIVNACELNMLPARVKEREVVYGLEQVYIKM